MKTMKYMLAAALCLLASTACSGNKQNEQNNEAQAVETNGGKSLIVFFSHAGDNYSVGNIKEGNTKILAGYISEMTGADQFEIKTSKYDGMAYKPLCDLAKEEQDKGELPEYEGAVENINDYDTIFIGGPGHLSTGDVHLLCQQRPQRQDPHPLHHPRGQRPRTLRGRCEESLS